MSKEKQIEEMTMTPLDVLANDINQHCPDLKENYCGHTHCTACLAHALYNAGYRKQGEGEWYLEHETYGRTICSNCGEEALQEYSWNDVLKGHLKYVRSNYCPNCGAKMKGASK